MSLLLLESFENYNSIGDLVSKQWSQMNSGSFASGGRTGSKSFACNNTAANVVKTVVPADEHATFIAGAGFFYSTPADFEVMRFMSDNVATAHVTISCNIIGQIRADRGTRGSGNVLGTSAKSVFPPSSWHFIEAKVTLSDTVGVCVVRVDGVEVINVTGQDTKNAGTKTVFDTMLWGSASGSTNPGEIVDDIYFCNGAGTTSNDFLGEGRIRVLMPNGNGAFSAGLGSDGNSVNNYQLVNEVNMPNSLSTYVDLANTNDEDTYTFDDLTETSGTIAAIQISTTGQKTDAGARNLAHVTRIGGTDYVSADQTLASGSFGWQITRRDVSPATSTAFTRAELNGAEFGVRAT